MYQLQTIALVQSIFNDINKVVVGLKLTQETKDYYIDTLTKNSDPSSESYLKQNHQLQAPNDQIQSDHKFIELQLEMLNCFQISTNSYKDTVSAFCDIDSVPEHPKTFKEQIDFFFILKPKTEELELYEANTRLKKMFDMYTKKSKLQFNEQSNDMGPVGQKNAQNVPKDSKVTNKSILQMVQGTGTFGQREDDIKLFYSHQCPECDIKDLSMDKASKWDHKTGKNFVEGMLDASYISAFAPGAKTVVANNDISADSEAGISYGNALLSFLIDLNERDAAETPQVLSLSLGSLSFSSCDMLCKKYSEKDNEDEDDIENSKQDRCWTQLKTQFQVCMFGTQEVEDRIDVEFQKLGLKGVTVLAASGDGGSHFSFGPFNSGEFQNELNNIICKEMNLPVYPTMSPYVLSVGGVQWASDGMQAPNCSSAKPCAWDQGGCGFSNKDVDDKLDFSKKVVEDYIITSKTGIYKSAFAKDGTYNAKGRAYPDVSLLAAFGIPLCTQGGCSGSGGTSASAPTMAGLVTLINDARLNAGKAPLGYLNPKLYSLLADSSVYDECMTDIFQDKQDSMWDIQSFSSCYGCDDEPLGFVTAKGWDAQTGFGQPKFDGLLKHLKD